MASIHEIESNRFLEDDNLILEKSKTGLSTSSYETFSNLINTESPVEAVPPLDVGFRPWVVVFGGFCAQFCSLGYMNIAGIFQEYYITHQLYGYTPSEVAWIVGLMNFVFSTGGLVVGRLFDLYGVKYTTIPGCILVTAGIIAMGSSTEYYQLILSQSICSALGASFLYYTSTACISSWFSERLGFASGIATSGTAVGGIVQPLIFNVVIERAGFQVSMYALAAVIFAVSIVSVFTLTRRIPAITTKSHGFTRYYLDPFKEPTFGLYAVSILFVFLGQFIPLAFISSYATDNGVSPTSAFYLVSYFSAGAFAGRLVTGFFADYIGHFSVFIIVTAFMGIVCAPGWMFCITEPSIIVIAILYGFSNGGIMGTYTYLAAKISPASEVGTRIGCIGAVASLGALAGAPIGGTILSASGYVSMFGFTASNLFLGSFIAAVCKSRYSGLISKS
ncbi:major facilitator superfamily domain-containing protein [Lipomyces japonicus]|uniref:major facilitator superfamily domain-containing protein n=1 Tax=Lipomyces japonicus TaxID=56871 RepID=UPI0034CF91AD